MSFRQAVVQLGSWTVKAGLWEQTFLPNFVPSIPRPADRIGGASMRASIHHR